MEIVLKKEDSYKARVENPSEMKESFFKDIYQSALNDIEDIAEFQGLFNSKGKIDVELNNIIAFVGERGSGKTSAMKSLLQGVCVAKNKEELFLNNEFSFKQNGRGIMELGFHQIDLVDPTLFSGKEQIIEVVISKMFKKFESEINRNEYEVGQDSNYVKGLMQAFQEVFSALRTLKINTEKLYGSDLGYSESDLERLNQLAVGPALHEKFEKLVDRYLCFWEKADKPKAMLIIPIDDVDLHMGSGEGVGVIDHLEDIRKYLCVSNVVVFLGVNLIQLQANLHQQYLKQYETIFEEKNVARFKEPQEMAVHFLEKFIPSKRRLVLPTLRANISKNCKILREDSNSNKLLGSTIHSVLRDLIERKIGINLITSEIYKYHPFLPQTLREFHHLFFLLDGMKDMPKFTSIERKAVFDGQEKDMLEKIDIRRRNLDYFTSYFKNVWCPANLTANALSFLKDWEQTPLIYKNKLVCTQLPNAIKNYDLANLDNASLISRIEIYDTIILSKKLKDYLKELVARTNYPGNVSLGDVLAFLKSINDFFENSEIERFVFALKCYYSFELYELSEINAWVAMLDNKKQDRRSEYLKHLKTLQLIIGESIYPPNAMQLLTSKEIQDSTNYITYSRSFFSINSLYKILKGKEKPDGKIPGLEMFLFFIKNYYPRPAYKEIDEILYLLPLHNQNKFASFDILFFLTSFLTPSEIASRYQYEHQETEVSFVKLNFDKEFISNVENWIIDYGLPLDYFNVELNEECLYLMKTKLNTSSLRKGQADDFNFFLDFFKNFKEVMFTASDHLLEIYDNSPFFFLKKNEEKDADALANSMEKFKELYVSCLNSNGWSILLDIINNPEKVALISDSQVKDVSSILLEKYEEKIPAEKRKSVKGEIAELKKRIRDLGKNHGLAPKVKIVQKVEEFKDDVRDIFFKIDEKGE